MNGGRLALFLTAVGTGAILIAAGWLLLRLARRAAAGTLKRNQIAGVRTRATLFIRSCLAGSSYRCGKRQRAGRTRAHHRWISSRSDRHPRVGRASFFPYRGGDLHGARARLDDVVAHLDAARCRRRRKGCGAHHRKEVARFGL